MHFRDQGGCCQSLDKLRVFGYPHPFCSTEKENPELERTKKSNADNTTTKRELDPPWNNEQRYAIDKWANVINIGKKENDFFMMVRPGIGREEAYKVPIVHMWQRANMFP